MTSAASPLAITSEGNIPRSMDQQLSELLDDDLLGALRLARRTAYSIAPSRTETAPPCRKPSRKNSWRRASTVAGVVPGLTWPAVSPTPWPGLAPDPGPAAADPGTGGRLVDRGALGRRRVVALAALVLLAPPGGQPHGTALVLVTPCPDRLTLL
jgi:hypothetical protein